MRPCTCDKVVMGQPFVAGRDCRLCWLYHHDQDYRRMWDTDHATVVAPVASQPVWRSAPPRRTGFWRAAGQFLSYAEAMLRWNLAGRPVTLPQDLAKREAACKACVFWDSVKDGCKVCGCGIEGGSLDQKRRMATEMCPANPPYW